MEWVQLTLSLITVAGLFIWNRAEARSDARMYAALLSAIKDEMKDFHGRLCAIEERNKR